MLAGLLHAFKIFTESGVNHVGDQLRVGAVLKASLSVEEPGWDTVFSWLSNNIGNLFNICLSELTGALVSVDLGNLESQDRETTTETLNCVKREGGFLLSVNVGVLHTQDVNEVLGVLDYEARHISLLIV